MRALILTGVSVALSLGLATPSEAACEPVGEIRFICDVLSITKLPTSRSTISNSMP